MLDRIRWTIAVWIMPGWILRVLLVALTETSERRKEEAN
jgi:hypothetical protein